MHLIELFIFLFVEFLSPSCHTTLHCKSRYRWCVPLGRLPGYETVWCSVPLGYGCTATTAPLRLYRYGWSARLACRTSLHRNTQSFRPVMHSKSAPLLSWAQFLRFFTRLSLVSYVCVLAQRSSYFRRPNRPSIRFRPHSPNDR